MSLKQDTGLRALLFVCIFCFVVFVLWFLLQYAVNFRDGRPMTLDQRIVASRTVLINGRDENGLFVYEADLLRGRISQSQNMVRQALGIMALGEYLYFFDPSDIDATVAVKQLLERFGQLSKPLSPNASVVTSPQSSIDHASTGATAIALMGALYYRQTTKDNSFDGLIESWKNALLHLYKDKAGFKRSPSENEEDPYYNGEGWSALALYYDMTKDKGVLKVLEKLAIYMPGKYPFFDMMFYHWGQRAAAYSVHGNVAVERMMNYVASQTVKFMGANQDAPSSQLMNCAFMEGLGIALPLLPPGSIRESAEKFFIENMDNNFNFQQYGRFRRSDGSMVSFADNMKRFEGSFVWNISSVETRVDATAHCLLAMLLQKRLPSAKIKTEKI